VPLFAHFNENEVFPFVNANIGLSVLEYLVSISAQCVILPLAKTRTLDNHYYPQEVLDNQNIMRPFFLIIMFLLPPQLKFALLQLLKVSGTETDKSPAISTTETAQPS